MITENVANIRNRISLACSKAGRDPQEITLVAVTKMVGTEYIRKAIEAGISDIGENYVQDIRSKYQELKDFKLRWHFIGHLQTNKVKYIAEWISMIHSVDSMHLGMEISKWMTRLNRTLPILIEVNTSGEVSKYGINPENTGTLLRDLSKLPNISVQGLMTMAPFVTDPEEVRPFFSRLRQLRDELQKEGYQLPVLSMGMTNDFEIAIEEGATIVRIGTAIFGERKLK